MNEYRITKNPLESTMNDLKLFEQTQYCIDFLKNEFPEKNDDEIKYHSEVASACFRQARQYYSVGNASSLETSPLLYSYAFNNILKGTCYLKSFDDGILKGFEDHGFTFKNQNIGSTILESRVNTKQHGALISLLNLFDCTLTAQSIDLNKILRHIPGLGDVYYKTTGRISFIASQEKNDKTTYSIYGDRIYDEERYIFKAFGMMATSIYNYNMISCSINIEGKKNIKENKFNKSNIYYKNFLILPDKYNEGIKDLNVSFYCYILIMAYGMLVRYNAHLWDNFIDKKISKESTLIDLSIKNAVDNFYYQIHNILFQYYYIDDSYNDIDVKKVISDSTEEIIENINANIRRHNYQYNSNMICPWKKNHI